MVRLTGLLARLQWKWVGLPYVPQLSEQRLILKVASIVIWHRKARNVRIGASPWTALKLVWQL